MKKRMMRKASFLMHLLLQYSAATVPSQWTPISMGDGTDPNITLCKINYDMYWRDPQRLSKFHQLQAVSNCSGNAVWTAPLSRLKTRMGGQYMPLQPTGFVFHESRCGSTVVANMLASDPRHLVFSEGTLPDLIAAKGESHVALLRDVMLLMCQSTFHTKCIFKFQSLNIVRIQLFLKAFPQTRWAFVFRDPVQVMMSQVMHKRSPCRRHQMRASPGHTMVLGKTPHNATSEEFCAAHLALLCMCALHAYGRGNSGGILLHYSGIQEKVVTVLLDHFKITVDATVAARMLQVSQSYSKSLTTNEVFRDDSERKVKNAYPAVVQAAQTYMYPIYFEMLAHAV